jgi:fucose 4-O-acetylase-like acetyltransferase
MAPSSVVGERAGWIEIAKGMAVIFVILVHSMIPDINPVTMHLSSFTIPIFFMLTGLTYNNERHRSHLANLAKARARQLLIPYFSLYTIMILLFLPLSSGVDTYLTPDQLVFWFLYGNGPPNSASHLWFLPVLYFALILFAVLDRIMYRLPRSLKWVAFVLLILAANAVWSAFQPVLVPWRASSILIATAFVLIGNELRTSRGLRPWTNKSRAKDIISMVLLTVLILTFSQLNGFTDMAVDRYGLSLWLYLAAGTSGCILVFQVSSVFDKSAASRQPLIALGAVSQEAYEVHPLTFYLIPIAAAVLGISLTDNPDISNHLWTMRFALGVTLSYVLVSRLIRKNRFLSLIFSGRFSRVRSTTTQS